MSKASGKEYRPHEEHNPTKIFTRSVFVFFVLFVVKLMRDYHKGYLGNSL